MKIPAKNHATDLGGTLITYEEMPKVQRPKFVDTLRFPEDITELSAANCSELLGKYTLLWTFVNQDMARLKVRLLRLQHQEGVRVSEMFRHRPQLNQIEKWKRDSVISEDTQVESLRRQTSAINVELEYSGMYLANYDRYILALSRELTRKTHEQGLNRA